MDYTLSLPPYAPSTIKGPPISGRSVTDKGSGAGKERYCSGNNVEHIWAFIAWSGSHSAARFWHFPYLSKTNRTRESISHQAVFVLTDWASQYPNHGRGGGSYAKTCASRDRRTMPPHALAGPDLYQRLLIPSVWRWASLSPRLPI